MQRWSKGVLLAGGAGLAAWLALKSLVRRGRWFDFAGKSVLIVGGSRGLGLVLARQLVDQEARVAICARTQEDIEAAAQELRRQGGDVLGRTCDVRIPADVERMVEEILSKWGRIDVLLNVAGVIEVGPLDTMTLADFHHAMETNCFGPLHAILAVLPAMRRQKWGRIVNVASIGGKQAVPHLLPYDMSKFALVGLSNGLRTELAKDGILVTTASPTLMRTGSHRNAVFKGRHRQEYAWFSIGGSLPFASLDAERAAAQILRACQAGEGDVFISNLLNPPVLAAQLAPRLTAEILGFIHRLLPSPGGIGQRPARGYESQSPASPSLLTAASDRAAEANNEMKPRPSPQA